VHGAYSRWHPPQELNHAGGILYFRKRTQPVPRILRSFCKREVYPTRSRWGKAGMVDPPIVWVKAGEDGVFFFALGLMKPMAGLVSRISAMNNHERGTAPTSK